MRRLATLMLASFLAATGSVAAPAAPVDPAQRVDALVRRFAALPNVPSVAVGVYLHGRISYLKTFGDRDLQAKLPANVNTLYDTASMGKQFTAAVALMLVEQHKVKLEAPLATYLPAMPHAKDVTVAQLLHMTAGYANLQTAIPEKGDAIAQIAYYAGNPLLFTPGSKYSYSNTNYELLGALIQSVTREPYATAMRKMLFAPLGMSGWRMLAPEPDLPNRAVGYVFATPVKWYRDESPQIATTLGASGSFRLNISDMMKYDADLFAHRVVSQSVWKQMSSPGRLNDGSPSPYGGGEIVADFNGHKIAMHTGGHPDVMTLNWVFPNDDLAIAIFVNAGWAPSEDLARAIAGAYLGIDEPKAPVFVGAASMPSAGVSADARAWLNAALAGKVKDVPDPEYRPWLADYVSTRKQYGAPRDFVPEFSQQELTIYHVTLGSTPFSFVYVKPPGFGMTLLPQFVPRT